MSWPKGSGSLLAVHLASAVDEPERWEALRAFTLDLWRELGARPTKQARENQRELSEALGQFCIPIAALEIAEAAPVDR